MIQLLWHLPLWLLGLLLWVLFRRRAYKISPCFFAYASFGVAASLARFFALAYPRAYFATYWLTEAGYCLLGILAMYEVLRSALGGVPRAWWARLIFPIILVASVGLSWARTQAVPAQVVGLRFWIVSGEIAVRFVQVFIFAGLASLVPLIGLRWRRYPFGVSMGFGFYATVMLLVTSKYADAGARFTRVWGIISIAAYSVAVLIWIWFFWAPAKIQDPESSALGPALG